MKNGLGNKKVMAKNIRHYMMLNGKTRSDMCEDLGIKYTTLTDWLKGNTYPRIDAIEKMANYFGVSKADLVKDPDPDQAGSGVDALLAIKDLKTLYSTFSDLEKRALWRGIIRYIEVHPDGHFDVHFI